MRNRNNESEYLYLLSIDYSSSDEEIVCIMETIGQLNVFLTAKSLLKVSAKFQSRSCNVRVNYTALIFTKYIILK